MAPNIDLDQVIYLIRRYDFIDGLTRVELHQFAQSAQTFNTVNYALSSSWLTPLFKDADETGFRFKDPSDPLRQVSFLAHQADLDHSTCLTYELTDNS